MLITKSDKVRALVKSGKFTEALRITKTFKLGLTKEQRATLVRAHEALTNPSFYAQLGKCPDTLISAGHNLLSEMYGA